ncbi:MAG: serine/threonine protein kinase [Lachnospiraceae bacterium]|nr:serine/threonine protein kinase [Lachnospiraceae bacterium]
MQNKYERCPNCMQQVGNADCCPYCNFDVAGYEEISNSLEPFTVLQNKYMVGRVIGVGGFGITYIGWDMNLQTYIAIKEYFPEALAVRDKTVSMTKVNPTASKKEVYDKGLTKYVEEARTLSKFYDLQGIVSVKDFFYENGTGYIVMEYINGITLKEYLKNSGGRLEENVVLALMKPVLASLAQIHNSGMLHRDISPDNIMVDNKNRIKLIDFGAARLQASTDDKTYTVMLKHGYAPVEQYYSNGRQGPWTDVYSICATMYKMLTGKTPQNSIERMESDGYISPADLGISISQRLDYVLRKGLAVRAEDRYQTVSQMFAELFGNQYGGEYISQPAPVSYTTGYENNNTGYVQKKKTGLVVGIIIGVVAVIAIVVALIFGLKGKDKKDDDTTTEKITTEDTTTEEPTTTEKETTEEITEDLDTEDPDTEEPDNTEDVIGEERDEICGVSFVIPEGFYLEKEDSTTISYVHDDAIAFVIAVDDANTLTTSDAISMFDEEIAATYGNHIYSYPVTYNGYSGIEWCTDSAEGTYLGRSLVFCEGDTLIYMEYVSYSGELTGYDEFVDSLVLPFERHQIHNVSYTVPEGFVDDESGDEDSKIYVYNDESMFLFGVVPGNYDEAEVCEMMDDELKVSYGDQIYSYEMTYNGHTGTEWVLDTSDGWEGRAFLICEDSMWIYVEYITYISNLDLYYGILESITY